MKHIILFFVKFILFLFTVVYVVSPLDVMPGPIDDVLLIAFVLGLFGGGNVVSGVTDSFDDFDE